MDLLETIKAHKNQAAIERLHYFGKITDEQYAELMKKHEVPKKQPRKRKAKAKPATEED